MTLLNEQQAGFSPTGPADDNDDETLLILALIALADIEQAAAYWRRLAPKAARGLILAKSGTTWNPEKMRFVGPGGAEVDPMVVRAAMLAFILAAQSEAERSADAMILGTIALAEWQAAMRTQIKNLHIAAAAVGMGGKQQLTAQIIARTAEEIPKDLQSVKTLGDAVAFHFGKLERFAGQIEARRPSADTEEDIKRRVVMYVDSAYPTHELSRRFAANVSEMTLESNVLDDADHCHAGPDDVLNDCPYETSLGWVPIGTLSLPGNRICLMNCKCHMSYKRGEA